MDLYALGRRPAVKRLLRRLIYTARLVVPAREGALLYGWPQAEPNAVDVVEHLGSLGVRVCWLLDDPDAPYVAELLARHPTVTARRRLSFGGFVEYLRARVVFFTHGLYLSPRTPGRKWVVNLWHGDGPKRNFMPQGEPPPRCDFVVSCSEVFGRSKAEFFGVPLDRLLVTGNPRNDRLHRDPSPEALAALGLRPHRFVVYMPTYRSARALGTTVAWDDASSQADPRVPALAALVEGARAAGLDVVVKPHPLDAIDLQAPGVRTLHDADLQAAGISTYSLLAGSHSLVTDYSSIWTDYLSTGRHVAFCAPDWDSYGATRGLDAAVEVDDLPGPVLAVPADAAAFFRAVDDDDDELVTQRSRAIATFGLVTAPGNRARLVEALEAHGVPLGRLGQEAR